jgi:hypothetical protein
MQWVQGVTRTVRLRCLAVSGVSLGHNAVVTPNKAAAVSVRLLPLPSFNPLDKYDYAHRHVFGLRLDSGSLCLASLCLISFDARERPFDARIVDSLVCLGRLSLPLGRARLIAVNAERYAFMVVTVPSWVPVPQSVVCFPAALYPFRRRLVLWFDG